LVVSGKRLAAHWTSAARLLASSRRDGVAPSPARPSDRLHLRNGTLATKNLAQQSFVIAAAVRALGRQKSRFFNEAGFLEFAQQLVEIALDLVRAGGIVRR